MIHPLDWAQWTGESFRENRLGPRRSQVPRTGNWRPCYIKLVSPKLGGPKFKYHVDKKNSPKHCNGFYKASVFSLCFHAKLSGIKYLLISKLTSRNVICLQSASNSLGVVFPMSQSWNATKDMFLRIAELGLSVLCDQTHHQAEIYRLWICAQSR